MPKPVPIPVRRKLLQRAQLGESTASLAAAFGLAPRTVRRLRKRFRDRGPDSIPPDYRRPKEQAHAYSDRVRELALGLRRQHPGWGAVLVWVALGARHPDIGPAQPQHAEALVPRRRAGAGAAVAAPPLVVEAGHRASPDVADRCLGTNPLGRRHPGLLAEGRRRGQRRRPGDDDFPPGPSGVRSTPGPPKPPCARCSHAGACPGT